MPPVGFEPTISAGERPQTYALDRAATGTGHYVEILYRIPPKAVKKYEKYWRKSCTSLCKAWLATTETIFMNLKVARPILQTTHIEFHEDATEDLIDDTRSQIGGRAGGVF